VAVVESDQQAIARYRQAVAALTFADRAWLRKHGWHDNSPKPYPEYGWTAEDLEPVYRLGGIVSGTRPNSGTPKDGRISGRGKKPGPKKGSKNSKAS
jgi:hypothetical protein